MGTADQAIKIKSTSDSAKHDPPTNFKARDEGDRRDWARLNLSERLALLLLLAVVLLVTIPRLPSGVCFSDPGELQLGSALAGILHPPGYAGYASLGYLVTRIPWVDPAYTITLACLGSGLLALWFCFAFQIRLGVNPWIASATCLILVANRRIWASLLVPEVYIPSLTFLVASAYMLMKYHRLGVRHDFFLSTFLYGFVLANRPPVLFALPFFILVWWSARKRWEPVYRESAITFLLGTAIIALPVVYSFTFYWFRDTPDAPLNYVQQYNECYHELQDVEHGREAKLERILWLVTAKQFSYKFGNSWRGVRSKLRWLKNDLLYGRPWILSMIIIMIIIGVVIAFMRDAAASWLLLGMGVHSVVFICLYRIYGQAADILPLLFSMTVFSGVVCTLIFSRIGHQHERWFTIIVAVSCSIWTVLDAPHRRKITHEADAIPFLKEVDLETFPRNALICAGWRHATPLWYAQHFLTDRPDLYIVAAEAPLWVDFAKKFPDRPVFVIHPSSQLKGHELVSFRNLWQLTLNPDIKN